MQPTILDCLKKRAAAVVGALENRGINENVLKSRGVGSAEATIPHQLQMLKEWLTEKLL